MLQVYDTLMTSFWEDLPRSGELLLNPSTSSLAGPRVKPPVRSAAQRHGTTPAFNSSNLAGAVAQSAQQPEESLLT